MSKGGKQMERSTLVAPLRFIPLQWIESFSLRKAPIVIGWERPEPEMVPEPIQTSEPVIIGWERPRD